MKVRIIWIGRTKNREMADLMGQYIKRLSHYCRLEIKELKEPKKHRDPTTLRAEEADLFLKQLRPGEFVVLLDEKGDQMTSVSFSSFLKDKMNASTPSIAFIIGGAFGSHEKMFHKCQHILSISKMTFTHDMCRVILLEQLYRAFSILKGEKYHNA